MNNKDLDQLLYEIMRNCNNHITRQIYVVNDLEIILNSLNIKTALENIIGLANSHPGLIIFGMGYKSDVLIIKYNREEFINELKENIKSIIPKIKYYIDTYDFRRYKLTLLYVDRLDILEMPAHFSTKYANYAIIRQYGSSHTISPPYYRSLKNIQSGGQLNESVRTLTYKTRHNDIELINIFNKKYKKLHKNIKISNGQIKYVINYSQNYCTLAFVLSFAKYPQLFYPYLYIETYNAETGELKVFDGPIYRMFYNCLSYIEKVYGYKIVISRKGIYRTKFCFHLGILKELLYNALIHRDLSVYSHQIPIKINLYKSSIEINNPGYSFIDGNVLDSDLKLPSNKYIKIVSDILLSDFISRHGFKYIRKAAMLYSMPKPNILNVDGFFKVTIKRFNSKTIYKEPYTIENIILFCKEARSKLELYQHFFMTDKTDYQYFYQKYIFKLVKNGFLVFTMPETPKSKYQKLIATEEALALLE